jgi:hypothetical protein
MSGIQENEQANQVFSFQDVFLRRFYPFFPFIKKWLIVLVFPGLPDILARCKLPVSRLIREDFPTFERPINPNSGLTGSGHCFNEALLRIYEAEWIIITNILI